MCVLWICQKSEVARTRLLHARYTRNVYAFISIDLAAESGRNLAELHALQCKLSPLFAPKEIWYHHIMAETAFGS